MFNNKKLRTIIIRQKDMIRLCVPFWVIWAIYHVVWMLVDVPKLTRMQGQGPDGEYATWHECRSNSLRFNWTTPVLVACTLVLVYGAVLCWEIRHVPTQFNESKFGE